jgi:hypothetical protein
VPLLKSGGLRMTTHKSLEAWVKAAWELCFLAPALDTLCLHRDVPALPFHSFGSVPRSRIVGRYHRSIFNFLRDLQTDFNSSCTILHSHHSCTSVSISPQYSLACFVNRHVNRCEMLSHCSFNLYFPDN